MIELFHTRCDDEEIEIVGEVLRSGKLILDRHVAGLEAELTHYLGRETVTCASGTDALVLALESLSMGLDKDVIVPASTFSATYEAVLRAGARPIVVDVDPDHLTMRLDQVVAATTERTGAVILVHMFGWAAPHTALIRDFCEQRHIELIEDCAQAFGARLHGQKVGTFGTAAAFSFYPTKPLGGIGDGGAASFVSKHMAGWARRRRNHGRDAERRQGEFGYNSRLDEANAAVLRRRLRRYETTRAHLNGLAAIYEKTPRDGAPYVFCLKSSRRDALRAFLAAKEIATGVHYDPPLSDLANRCCENAAAAAKLILSLPCHRAMSVENAAYVRDRVSEFVAGA